MLGLSDIQGFMVTATAFLVAFAAFLRTVLPIGRKLDEALTTLRDLNHQWVTNGRTGLRDTITILLDEVIEMRAELKRGSEKFRVLETGQHEAAERGEAILAEQARLREKLEGR